MNCTSAVQTMRSLRRLWQLGILSYKSYSLHLCSTPCSTSNPILIIHILVISSCCSPKIKSSRCISSKNWYLYMIVENMYFHTYVCMYVWEFNYHMQVPILQNWCVIHGTSKNKNKKTPIHLPVSMLQCRYFQAYHIVPNKRAQRDDNHPGGLMRSRGAFWVFFSQFC